MSSEDGENRLYTVVKNAEAQYSIWLSDSAIPEGWSEVGKRGTKSECLTYIGQVWTDMRPASLRAPAERT